MMVQWTQRFWSISCWCMTIKMQQQRGSCSLFHRIWYDSHHNYMAIKCNVLVDWMIFFCRTSKVLSEMRSTFGNNECNLLCTNSSKEGNVEHQANPWASFVSHSSKILSNVLFKVNISIHVDFCNFIMLITNFSERNQVFRPTSLDVLSLVMILWRYF